MLKVGGIPVDESDKDFWPGNNVDEIEEALRRYENQLSWEDKLKDIIKEQLTDDLNWLNSQEMVTIAQKVLLKFGKNLSDFLTTPAHADDVIENVKQQVTSAKSTSSPIILDLNNNGIETTSVKQGAYFDHANDGFAEQTGWVGANDGLLVRDNFYNKNDLRQYAA